MRRKGVLVKLATGFVDELVLNSHLLCIVSGSTDSKTCMFDSSHTESSLQPVDLMMHHSIHTTASVIVKPISIVCQCK